jgi:DNA-binding beta-propeller fold protein YncE
MAPKWALAAFSASLALLGLIGAATGSPYVFVAVLQPSPTGNKVVQIDAGANPPTIAATCASHAGDISPFEVALSPDNALLYVTYFRSGTLGVFDASTCAHLGSMTLSDGKGTALRNLGPKGIAVTPDGAKAYVALNGCTIAPGAATCGGAGIDNQDNAVAVLDLTTTPPTQVGTVTTDWGPFGVTSDPLRDRIYVSSFCGTSGPATSATSCGSVAGTVQAIETSNDGVDWSVATPVGGPQGMAYWLADQQHAGVYVALNSFDGVAHVDRFGATAFPLGLGSSPRDLVVSPDGNLVYVVEYGANSLVELTPSTGMSGTPLRLSSARESAFKPILAQTASGDRLFIVGFDAMEVTPVDISGAAPAIGAPIPLGGRALGGAATCTPSTRICAGRGYECGRWWDGCNGTIRCGSCAPGSSCQDGRCIVHEKNR